MNKIGINNFNKLKNSSNIVFFTGSNYSLLLFKIILSIFRIKNYKIIFCGNNKYKFIKFFKHLKLEEKNLLIIKGNYSYSYYNFILNKKLILNQLNNFISNEKFDYLTSHNYGLVNYLIIDKFKISNFYLLEDGVVNYINNKIKFLFLKNIIYSLIFKKIVYLPKNWENDKNIFTKITTAHNQNNYQNLNFNKIFKNFLVENRVKIKRENDKNYNILVICAKIFHYKKGIENFLNEILQSTNPFLLKVKKNKNIKIFIKLHPSDFDLNLENDNLTIVKLKKDFIPIEFFDLSFFDLIFSPPNTSIINLKINNLFDNDSLFYYEINQHELEQKYLLMNKYKINKLII
jgi:hypothetical protein